MKSFVIYKNGDLFSTQLAEECILSAKKFNIDVEKFPGIYDNVEELFLKEGLHINKECNGRMERLGVKGCLLSHLAVWKLCLKLKEPILVFEHDGLMINPLPDDVLGKFNDFLNLDLNRKVYRKNLLSYDYVVSREIVENTEVIKMEVRDGNGFKFINRNHIVGAHGYIIKPSGAEKIIGGLLTDGAIPADMAPNSKYVEMFHSNCTIVRVNPLMTKSMTKLSHTRN